MKKTLLLSFLLAAGITVAQNPIATLNGTLAAGEQTQPYQVVNVTANINQAVGGMNMLWNFGLATPVIGKSYINATPTAEMLDSFPGSAMMSIGVETNDPDFTDITFLSSSYALTGVVNDEYVIYYDTDPGSFGTFPLQYGDLTADTVGGSYFYDGYEGTFTGTLTSEVDAYGTATFGPNESAFVTRLRSVEVLELSYPGFGVVGSYVQTTYRYYREGDKWPVFKSTRTTIDIPALEIDSDVWVYEKADVDLATGNHDAIAVAVSPNPVRSKAYISGAGEQLSVTVTDLLGKTVLEANGAELDFSSLPSGMYLARITGAQGTTVKKIVKD